MSNIGFGGLTRFRANNVIGIPGPAGAPGAAGAQGPAGTGLTSVKTFGATGNGSTDDTTSIQNALASAATSGGRCYFPKGTYKITSALAIPAGVIAFGDGPGLTTVSQSTAATSTVTITDASEAVVQDMTLASAGGADVVVFKSTAATVNHPTLDNVSIIGFGAAGKAITVSGSTINCTNHGYTNGTAVQFNALVGGAPYAQVTFASSTVTITAHGLAASDPVQFDDHASLTLPSPLQPRTTYYVKSPTANSFQLSTTPGGAAITFTGTGSPNTAHAAWGVVPGGLNAYSEYYVVGATTNTFQVAATSGGAALTLTAVPSTTCKVGQVFAAVRISANGNDMQSPRLINVHVDGANVSDGGARHGVIVDSPGGHSVIHTTLVGGEIGNCKRGVTVRFGELRGSVSHFFNICDGSGGGVAVYGNSDNAANCKNLRFEVPTTERALFFDASSTACSVEGEAEFHIYQTVDQGQNNSWFLGSDFARANQQAGGLVVNGLLGRGGGNVNTLRTMGPMPVNGITVDLAGYAQIQDGGEGLWTWDATGTDTDDIGTVIETQAVTPGRYRRLAATGNYVNVAWFGGMPNAKFYNAANGKWYQDSLLTTEATDDAVKFQRAINYATAHGITTVFVPAANWYFTTIQGTHLEFVRLAQGNLTIRGDGMHTTLIWVAPSAPHYTCIIGNADGGYTGTPIEIDNVHFSNFGFKQQALFRQWGSANFGGLFGTDPSMAACLLLVKGENVTYDKIYLEQNNGAFALIGGTYGDLTGLNNGQYLMRNLLITGCILKDTGADPNVADSSMISVGAEHAIVTENRVSNTIVHVTGALSGTGGVVRLNVDSNVGFFAGESVLVASVVGSGGLPANGSWVLSAVGSTSGQPWIELTGTTFVGAWVSGGSVELYRPATSPFEVHGNDVVVANNTVAAMHRLLNLGGDSLSASGFKVTHNTAERVGTGITIFNYNNLTIRGLIIDGNTIGLVKEATVATPPTGTFGVIHTSGGDVPSSPAPGQNIYGTGAFDVHIANNIFYWADLYNNIDTSRSPGGVVWSLNTGGTLGGGLSIVNNRFKGLNFDIVTANQRQANEGNLQDCITIRGNHCEDCHANQSIGILAGSGDSSVNVTRLTVRDNKISNRSALSQYGVYVNAFTDSKTLVEGNEAPDATTVEAFDATNYPSQSRYFSTRQFLAVTTAKIAGTSGHLEVDGTVRLASGAVNRPDDAGLAWAPNNGNNTFFGTAFRLFSGLSPGTIGYDAETPAKILTTSNTTATFQFSDNISQAGVNGPMSAVAEVYLVARRTGGTRATGNIGDSIAWKATIHFKNIGGTITIVGGSVNMTLVTGDSDLTGAPMATPTVSVAGGAINVQGTGLLITNFTWSAFFEGKSLNI